MKKKNLIIGSILLLAVIIVVSIYYPPVDESETAGTIGKVDKYRNSVTAQQDIHLRNELLKDTTVLKSTIEVLDSYHNYLTDFSNDISDWETSLKKMNLQDDELSKQLDELKSLSVFMNNNLITVAQTRELLNKYYTKDTLNLSVDLQNNIIQFGNFVQNLSEKDKVIDELFQNLSGIVAGDKLKLLTKTKEQADELIAVREKMLGGIFIFGYMLGNESRLDMALSSTVYDSRLLNIELNNKLSIFWPLGSNAVEMNKEQLNGLFNREVVGLKNTSNESALGPIVYTAKMASELNGKTLGALLNLPKLGLWNKDGGFTGSQESLDALKGALGPAYAAHLGLFSFSLNNLMGNMNKNHLGPFGGSH